MNQDSFDAVTEAMIETALRSAQHSIWEHDRELLINDVSERTLCGRFAFYLIKRFSRFDVDLEYNRNHKEADYFKRIYDTDIAREILDARRARNVEKRLTGIEEEGLIVWPDVIVHIRDTSFNLLVVEAKKSSSRVSSDVDRHKLDAIKETMAYRFAAFVRFPVKAKAKQDGANAVDWFELR